MIPKGKNASTPPNRKVVTNAWYSVFPACNPVFVARGIKLACSAAPMREAKKSGKALAAKNASSIIERPKYAAMTEFSRNVVEIFMVVRIINMNIFERKDACLVGKRDFVFCTGLVNRIL